MARRRYGEVTSGSGKSHQGRRITMAQPVSSILGDVVKSSRSIAHSDDFEGHKLIQTNSRQLILLDLNILYWRPASRGSSKQQQGAARSSNNRQAVGEQQQQASSRWAAAGKQQQVATSSSKQQHGAASSMQAAGEQQQASSSKQQQAASSRQAAGKQQASSRQAAGKQQPAFAPLKEWSNIFCKNQCNKKLNFFQAHGPKTMKSFNYKKLWWCQTWTFSRRTASRYDFYKLIRLNANACSINFDTFLAHELAWSWDKSCTEE